MKNNQTPLIPAGVRVQIDAPDARGIHGKHGTVEYFSHISGDYAVLVDGFKNPSFLTHAELKVLSLPHPQQTVIESLRTKIEEYRETIDPTDFSVDGMVQRIATESTIRGLELAVQIVEENG